MPIMKRWRCPSCESGVLAPSKPRKDDVRRYCLPCSESGGRLVERIAPALQAKRELAHQKASAKARKRRANQKIHQVDLNVQFACGLNALSATIYSPRMLIEVRTAKRPREPRIKKDRLVVYDYPGCDPYDARATLVLGELRYYCRHNPHPDQVATYVADNIERVFGERQVTTSGIANLLRAAAAVCSLVSRNLNSRERAA